MNDILGKIRKTVRLSERLHPVKEKFRALRDKKLIEQAHRNVKGAHIDSNIIYPSYKSFDEYINVEQLKKLDSYLRDRLEPRSGDTAFWTGPYTLKILDDRLPGSKMIELAKNTSPTANYFDLDKPDIWEPSEHAEHFPEVMEFVRTLPFKSIGRILIMYDFNGRAVTPHRDHDKTELSHEFIWFRPSLTKPFFVMDHTTGERQYVKSYSAWFDTVNQFHGADAANGFSISLRVDGKFSDELRGRIPVPTGNAASTASLWSSIGDNIPA